MEATTEMPTETGFTVTDYSEKAFVVSGELTRTHKDSLRSLGGKFNKHLKGEVTIGWIFSKKRQEEVMEFVLAIHNGEEPPSSSATSMGIPSMNDMGMPVVNTPSNTSKYQFVKFKVFRPAEGIKAQLKSAEKTVEGSVTKIETNDGIVDTVYIDFDGKTSMGVICRSKWQIFVYLTDHTN